MVHQWYIITTRETSKLLKFNYNVFSLVRVRVPLSAHNISDLAIKSGTLWYIKC